MDDGVITIKDKPAAGPVIRLHDNDNVLIARSDIAIGTRIEGGLTAKSQVPAGHKIAARAIKKGEPILKYAVTIGFASADIPAGTYVHSHNLEFREFDRDYAYARDYKPEDMIPEAQRAPQPPAATCACRWPRARRQPASPRPPPTMSSAAST